MDLSLHNALLFVHVVLFAFWLGADVGVFLGGGYMSRPGLSADYRNRIRAVVMDIDLLPRLALVGMLPVGFQLSLDWGAPLPASWLPLVWSAALAWLAVLLALHFAHGRTWLAPVLRADLALRSGIMLAMFAAAAAVMRGALPDVPGWLGIKFLLFGLIILVGIVLRYLSAQWSIAMARLAVGDVAGGEALLRVRRQKAKAAALVMWSLVAAAGFFGAVKPV